MLKVSRKGLTLLKSVLQELKQQSDFASLDLPHLLNALIARGQSIEVIYVHGHWRGVNDLEELRSAVDFAHTQMSPVDRLDAGREDNQHLS
jgi:phosphoenolpyruvate phosphomutase